MRKFLSLLCSALVTFVPLLNAAPPKVTVKFMTNSDCYNTNRSIVPKGIMVHSTATPGVMAERWFVLWNKSYQAGEFCRQVCVHAFLDDENIYQYLPWAKRAWHCGRANPGGPSGNDTHISFEICEPQSIKYDDKHVKIVSYNPKDEENQKYFENIWKNSVWLCAKLCEKFKINPSEIISHQEGYAVGIASNHGDPMHWWKHHGKTMDDMRSDVFTELFSRLIDSILNDKSKRKFFLGDTTQISDVEIYLF